MEKQLSTPKPHYDEDQTRILVNNLQKLTRNNIKYLVAILLYIY